ncbi:hypothetical protein FACS1894139_15010 [Planctomycetales bacterium]|nr:hypothetical protein FACS1894108_09920 [Planctomycetales bacterium]GHT07208.1 hypothetical protein FACS1894139_15010 [Planctomycetales bacterium]
MSLPPKRWLWALALLAVAYLSALSVATSFVNRAVLRERLDHWLNAVFADTSPVEINELSLKWRVGGRVDLILGAVEAEAPDAGFALPWLKIGRLRAGAPFWQLWAEQRPDAQIIGENLQLRLQWRDGKSNLDGLQLAARPGFPFSNFDPGDFFFALRDGKIILDHPLLAGALTVNGSGAYQVIGDDRASLDELKIAGALTAPDRRSSFKPTLSFDRWKWNLETFSPPFGELRFSNVPLRFLNVLADLWHFNLPSLPAEAVVGGEYVARGAAGEWRGEIRHPALPDGGVRAVCRWDDGDGRIFTVQLLTASDRQLIGGRWTVKDGRCGTLEVFIPNLDFAVLPRWQDAVWGRWLMKTFPAVRLTVGQITVRHFTFNETQFTLTPAEDDAVNIAADTLVANGKAILLTDALPLSGGLPHRLRLILDVPELGNTLLFFSDLLPPLYQIRPLRGSGQATLRYERDADEQALVLYLALNNVLIPGVPAGELLRALQTLKDGLREAENMTRRASLNAPPLMPPTLGDESELLALTSLVVGYKIDRAGKDALTFLQANSPQLGDLEGQGEEMPDGSFRLTLRVKNAPPALLAELSPAVRVAAESVLEKSGWSLAATATATGGTVERRYIQDIFKEWLQADKH